jgi:hypothetical protein
MAHNGLNQNNNGLGYYILPSFRANTFGILLHSWQMNIQDLPLVPQSRHVLSTANTSVTYVIPHPKSSYDLAPQVKQASMYIALLLQFYSRFM